MDAESNEEVNTAEQLEKELVEQARREAKEGVKKRLIEILEAVEKDDVTYVFTMHFQRSDQQVHSFRFSTPEINPVFVVLDMIKTMSNMLESLEK